MTANSQHDLPVISQFETLEVLGSSVSSLVYKARDNQHQSVIALKLAATAAVNEQLRHEIGTMNHFRDSSSCMKMLSQGEYKGMTYFTMPYYEGRLGDEINAQAGVSLGQHIELFKKLIAAVQVIHQKGFVHGDIHPHNIYVTDSDELVIGDFAHARSVQDSQTDDNTRKGPEGFASPQLLAGKPCSENDDVFSLCACFSAILAGTLNAKAITAWHLENRTLFPTPLQTLLDRGLHQIQDKRFANIHELTQALKLVESEAALDIIVPKYVDAVSGSGDGSPNAQLENEQIQTQPRNEAPKLAENTQTLYNLIESALRKDGFVRNQDAVKWCAMYLNENVENTSQISSNSQVNNPLYIALESQCKTKLSAEGLGPWLDWTEQAITQINESEQSLSKSQIQHLLEQGVNSKAADAFTLKQWLSKHALSKGSGQKKLLALASAAVLVIMAFSLAYLYSNDQYSNDQYSNDQYSNNQNIKPQNRQASDSSPSIPSNTEAPAQSSEQSMSMPSEFTQLNEEGNSSSSAASNNKDAGLRIQDAKTGDTLQLELLAIDEGEQGFEILRTEVSQGMWQACVNAGECRSAKVISTDAKRKSLNDANRPVINVSWLEITQDFIPFVNAQTGEVFSLPTMQEWLVIGFSKDNTLRLPNALQTSVHCADCGFQMDGRAVYQSTKDLRVSVPVSSGAAGPLGLYHVFGNAQEWLQDCWQDVKLQQERCDQAPVVGGSYLDDRQTIVNRPLDRLLKTARSSTTGFRLVKREKL